MVTVDEKVALTVNLIQDLQTSALKFTAKHFTTLEPKDIRKIVSFSAASFAASLCLRPEDVTFMQSEIAACYKTVVDGKKRKNEK